MAGSVGAEGIGTAIGGAAGGTGGLTQPASNSAATSSGARRDAAPGERGMRTAMGWIVLEALVALALAVGIVWWTMGPTKKRRAQALPDADPGSDQADEANADAVGRADKGVDKRAPR